MSARFSKKGTKIISQMMWILLLLNVKSIRVWIFKEVISLRLNLWSVKHFLDISFVKIRFSFYQNIGETLIQFKKSVSPRLDPPVIKTITGGSNFDERNVQEMFNWSEVHSERNNFFRNPYFRRFHQILETFLENLVCMKTR